MSQPTAIVTGASRGIGRAISQKLADHDFLVTGISRKIEPGSPFALTLKGDISELDVHKTLVNQVVEKFGRIDLLVNNAGIAPLVRKDIMETDATTFDQVLGVNLRGTFFFTQAVVRSMLQSKKQIPDYQPSIIFITSISAVTSTPNRSAYCISKAGLSMAARLFADRLTVHGIPVFEIRPGITHTDMTRPSQERYDKMIKEGLVPMGRWGEPEDIAQTVLALANGALPYSTGNVIELSGGMNIRHL